MSLVLSGSDGLSDVDGSAATPAIRGTDVNTGIFFPAADTIAFAEGGAEVMRIDSSGNVGIGTSSTSGARLAVRSGTGTAHTILGNDYGALYFETASGGPNRITSLNSALSAGQALAFNGSGGAEWGRFDTSGNLLVNTTATSGSNLNGFTVQTYVGGIISYVGHNGSAAGGDGYFVFQRSGTTLGSITQVSSTGVAYNTTSDYRLKENVQPMTGALARVTALKPVTYKWKIDGSDGQGFIAHELQAVEPGCVTGEKDAVDAEGKPQYQGIDTSFLVATLTAAIQEQQAIITALTARVEALEGTQP
jgi:hypothetical protein